MQEIREHIANDSFEEFRKDFYNKWEDYKPLI
jgi:queuine/archaeosine tRNA-ribosyltransferase